MKQGRVGRLYDQVCKVSFPFFIRDYPDETDWTSVNWKNWKVGMLRKYAYSKLEGSTTEYKRKSKVVGALLKYDEFVPNASDPDVDDLVSIFNTDTYFSIDADKVQTNLNVTSTGLGDYIVQIDAILNQCLENFLTNDPAAGGITYLEKSTEKTLADGRRRRRSRKASRRKSLKGSKSRRRRRKSRSRKSKKSHRRRKSHRDCKKVVVMEEMDGRKRRHSKSRSKSKSRRKSRKSRSRKSRSKSRSRKSRSRKSRSHRRSKRSHRRSKKSHRRSKSKSRKKSRSKRRRVSSSIKKVLKMLNKI